MKWTAPLLALSSGFAIGALVFGWRPSAGPEGSVNALRQDRSALPGEGPQPSWRVEAARDPAEAGDADDAGTAISTNWLESLEALGPYEQFGAMHERLRKVSVSELKGLVESFGPPYRSALSWQMRAMIAARWAELDPQGLRAYAETQPRNDRWHLLQALYSEWARRDLSTALAAAEGLPRNEKNAALSSIVGALASSSPEAALGVLTQQLKFDRDQQWMYRQTFQAWARRDRDAAMAAASSLEDRRARSAAMLGVVSQLAIEDPQAALGWLDGQSQDADVKQSRNQILNQILSEDPDAVLRYVDSQSDSVAVRGILEGINFQQLGHSGDFERIESTLLWLDEVATGQTHTQKTAELVRAMVQADPERARSFVETMPAGAARMQSISALAQSLGEQDIELALGFYQSLTYEDEREQARSSLSWQLVQNDFERAKEIVLTGSDPALAEQLAGQVAQQLSDDDIGTALEWVGRIRDDAARASSLSQVVQQWAVADPVAAFGYLDALEGSEDTVSLYQSAMNSYLRDNPVAAVEQLDRLAAQGVLGDRADGIYRQAASEYIRHDPLAASQWIATLEPGSNRDAAVNSLVREVSRYDAEAGFEWAATMDNERNRRRALEQSVREWVKSDVTAAKRAIESARLEASEKERLFKLIP